MNTNVELAALTMCLSKIGSACRCGYQATGHWHLGAVYCPKCLTRHIAQVGAKPEDVAVYWQEFRHAAMALRFNTLLEACV